jgi:hypothetical protein
VDLRFELADGKRERLSEAELDSMCDVLWSCDEKGALNIAVKISHERRRPSVLQEAIRLSEREGPPFRRALGRTRDLSNGRGR